MASGIYLLSKPENDGIISDNKYQTIVQNDSNDNELDKNNSLSINDNSSSSDTSSNTGNSNVLVSNNGKGDQTQTGDKNPANSGGSSNQNNSDYSTNISKPGTPNIPSKPSLPGNTDEPSNPGVPEEPNEPNNPGVPEEPNEPNNPEVPGEPNEPSNPEEPEIVVTDITITKDDLVDGVVTLSNKTYKNISIDSSVANGKVILDNIEVQEKLILEDGVQYQVKINNSKVPYVKVESNDIKRYRNISLNINKNISGPTLYLENVEEINKVDINGNVSIYGDSEISNLSLLNGILLLDIPTKIMNIDENSIYADITINKKVNEINDNVDKVNLNGKRVVCTLKKVLQ